MGGKQDLGLEDGTQTVRGGTEEEASPLKTGRKLEKEGWNRHTKGDQEGP